MRIVATFVCVLALASAALAQAAGKGLLAGRVVDERGKGIEGASVLVLGAAGEPAGEAKTNAKGEFSVEVAPGSYQLEVSADGYATASLRAPVTVEEGRRTKLKRKVELASAELGSILRGSVFDADGRSVVGARVLLERVPSDDGAPVPSYRREARSDAMGLFSFHVPKGEARYRVTASRDGASSQPITVDVFGGELLNVPALRLAPPAPEKTDR